MNLTKVFKLLLMISLFSVSSIIATIGPRGFSNASLAQPKSSVIWPLVYVYPETISAEVGKTFNVSVVVCNLRDETIENPNLPGTISPLGNLYGFDIQLSWDPTVLRYVNHIVTIPWNAYKTPIPPSPYAGLLHEPAFAVNNIVDENDAILGALPGTLGFWAYASMLPAPPFNGNGTVCILTFEVSHHGDSDLEFVWVDLVDDRGLPILFDKKDGHFVSAGAQREHDVCVAKLDAGWGASFKLPVIEGENTTVRIAAVNNGLYDEETNVTLYCNNSTKKNWNVTMTSGTSTWLEWKGKLDSGFYNLTAVAEIPDDEYAINNQIGKTIQVIKAPALAISYSPEEPIMNDMVSFNASASVHGETGGTITSYSWEFWAPNANIPERILTGINVTYSLTKASNWTIYLNVEDNYGISYSTERYATQSYQKKITVTVMSDGGSSVFPPGYILLIFFVVIVAVAIVVYWWQRPKL